MPSLDTSLYFLAVSLAIGFAPGPDNLFVLVQSAAHGRGAGMRVVLGLCTGIVVHTLAVALGLAAVVAASATAFDLLKLAGCAYLLYLAWVAWRSTRRAPGDAPPAPDGALTALAPLHMYARGVVMNLTNPKVILFFAAFLPQFVDAARGPVALQVAWFGLLFVIATILSFGTISWFAAAAGARLLRSPRVRRALGRIEALVFAGLAVRLALEKA